jgi:hypothetical protein
MEKQGNEDSPRRRGRSRYPKEFRRDAAAPVIDQIIEPPVCASDMSHYRARTPGVPSDNAGHGRS